MKQRRKFFEEPDEVKAAKEEGRAAKRAKKEKDDGVGKVEGKKGRGRSKSAKVEGGDVGSEED